MPTDLLKIDFTTYPDDLLEAFVTGSKFRCSRQYPAALVEYKKRADRLTTPPKSGTVQA